MASFSLKTEALETRWDALETQIQTSITENPKLQEIMDQIRRRKHDSAWQNPGQRGKKQGNVIDLRDFLDP